MTVQNIVVALLRRTHPDVHVAVTLPLDVVEVAMSISWYTYVLSASPRYEVMSGLK